MTSEIQFSAWLLVSWARWSCSYTFFVHSQKNVSPTLTMPTRMIGNAALRKAHISGYTTNAHAATIGATGTCISAFIVGLVSHMCGWQGRRASPVFLYTLAGVIGSATLRHYHVDIGGIDIPHSAGAGALGGIMISIGLTFAEPFVVAIILTILSPLFFATIISFQWVCIRSIDIWEHRGGYDYYGGRAEEFDAQLAHFEQEINRLNMRRDIGIED